MKPGEVVHNVKCCICGDLMKTAVVRWHGDVTCSKCCRKPDLSCGNVASSGHYADDPSGASGAWDAAVKVYEGE